MKIGKLFISNLNTSDIYSFSPDTDSKKSKDSFNCHGVSAKEADGMNDDVVTSMSCSDVLCSTRVSHEINLKSPDRANNRNDDVKSLDEGVGDISSECEHEANDHLGDQNDKNNNKSDPCDGDTSYSPEKERIASIF